MQTWRSVTNEGLSRMTRWDDDEVDRSSLDAAKEAAAKVNTMLIAKGKLKPSQLAQQGGKQPKPSPVNNLVIAEVDINDVPISCRNMLTRGSTQEEISKYSGAAISTRGRYLSQEEKMRNVNDRPLYLCVQGPNRESLDLAVNRIQEMIAKEMKAKGTRFSPAIRPPAASVQATVGAPLPRPLMSQPPPTAVPIGAPLGVTLMQEKLYIGLEHAPPSFDVKNKMLGPGGSYLQHIQVETGAKVTLRGKGSGCPEAAMGREAFEPMHVHLQHPTLVGLQSAKQLAENLIQTVQQEYAQFQQALAAMPATITPGTTTLLAGYQPQPATGSLINTPGGLATLSTFTQPLVSVSQPGLLVPTSIVVTSLPQGPTVSSVFTDPLISVGSSVAGGLPPQAPPQQVLIQTPVPPPAQMQTLPSLAGHQGEPLGNLPAPGQGLVTTIQPDLHIVSSQPAGMVWGGPSVQAPPPNQPPPHWLPAVSSMYAPAVMQPHTTVSSSLGGTIVTSSAAYTYSPREEKRRFTEEKQDDKVPENLLGYEHGPPHLTNLVVHGPPPPSSISHISGAYEGPALGVHTLPPPGYTLAGGIPLAVSSSQVTEDRLVSSNQSSPGSASPLHSSQQQGLESPNQDKKLMPPPPGAHGVKRHSTQENGHERKKHRASPVNTEEDRIETEESANGKQHPREARKYQYNQYSGTAQMYSEPVPSQAPSPHQSAGAIPLEHAMMPGQSLLPPPPPHALHLHQQPSGQMPAPQPPQELAPPQHQDMPIQGLPPPHQELPAPVLPPPQVLQPPPEEHFLAGQYAPHDSQPQQNIIQPAPVGPPHPQYTSQPPPFHPQYSSQYSVSPVEHTTYVSYSSMPSDITHVYTSIAQSLADNHASLSAPRGPDPGHMLHQLPQRLPEELPPGLAQRLAVEPLQPPNYASLPPPHSNPYSPQQPPPLVQHQQNTHQFSISPTPHPPPPPQQPLQYWLPP